jgi:hypothetical protein
MVAKFLWTRAQLDAGFPVYVGLVLFAAGCALRLLQNAMAAGTVAIGAKRPFAAEENRKRAHCAHPFAVGQPFTGFGRPDSAGERQQRKFFPTFDRHHDRKTKSAGSLFAIA